jgi:hypothetical protein
MSVRLDVESKWQRGDEFANLANTFPRSRAAGSKAIHPFFTCHMESRLRQLNVMQLNVRRHG